MSITLIQIPINIFKKSHKSIFNPFYKTERLLKKKKKKKRAPPRIIRKFRNASSSNDDNEKLKSSKDGVFKSGQNNFIVPKQLVSVEEELSKGKNCVLTVYSMRFTTGNIRGSTLSEPDAKISACLIGQNGKAFLTSIMPVHDPLETHKALYDICKMTDASSGADRLMTLKSLQKSKNSMDRRSKQHRRFQKGSVDEVSVLGPDIGPLTALLIGPESGTWNLEDVTISSSRTQNTLKFICRQKLGEKNNPAVVLRPIPEDTIIYGSGDTAVALSKKEAYELRLASLQDYTNYKNNLLLTTGGLVASGTCFTALVIGDQFILPFALGGSMGFVYQVLLQRGVDAVAKCVDNDLLSAFEESKDAQVMQIAVEDRLARVVGSAVFRTLFLGLMAIFAIWALKYYHHHYKYIEKEIQDTVEVMTKKERLQQLLVGFIGFSMYKVANVCVALSDNKSAEDA